MTMKLVLLPGLDGTGVLFRPLLAALPPSIEPVVVTYPTQEPLGYEELLPLARAALPKEPFVLLGESFGGPLSLRVAAAYPPGLRGLILCGTFLTCPFAWVPRWTRHAIVSFPFRLFSVYVRLYAALGLYECAEHYALAKEAVDQVAPAVWAHRVREIITVDATHDLRACQVPILYIQGLRDAVVGAANLRRIQAIRPDVHVARIDSGHMILKTRPRESAAAIEAFAATV